MMASTADIQVSASRGRTTQELHREALPGVKRANKREGEEEEGEETERRGRGGGGEFNPIADQTIQSLTCTNARTHTQRQ